MGKRKLRLYNTLLLVCCSLILSGCSVYSQYSTKAKAEIALRQSQYARFETLDRCKVLRAVILTFQDMGFHINYIDEEEGVVSAEKRGGYQLTMKASVAIYSSGYALVKVDGSHMDKALKETRSYGRFFDKLSKTLFITPQQGTQADAEQQT